MIITRIDSTTLAAAGYDVDANLLYLEFRDGTAYCYIDVPNSVYDDLLRAPSKGAYFNRSIRSRFSYRRAA